MIEWPKDLKLEIGETSTCGMMSIQRIGETYSWSVEEGNQVVGGYENSLAKAKRKTEAICREKAKKNFLNTETEETDERRNTNTT